MQMNLALADRTATGGLPTTPSSYPGISVFQSDDMASVRVAQPGISPIILRNVNHWSQIEGVASLAAEHLRKLPPIPQRLDLTPEARDRLLSAFHSLGILIYARLMGNRKSVQYSLGTGVLDDRPSTRLEFSFPDSLTVPFELLPILNPDRSQYLSQIPDGAIDRAAAFVGFGAVSHRALRLPTPITDVHVDSASVNYYWHTGLRGAKAEWRLMKRFFGDGAVGPCPIPKETRKRVLDDVIAKPGRGGPSYPAAVQHFSCHHDRGRDGGSDVIRLKPGLFRRELRFTADEISAAGVGRQPLPGLVFLNACSTQLIPTIAVSSIVREFSLSGRSAIVATWCDVPDLVGAKMSAYFYRAFTKGLSVDESIRLARVALLLKYNNPLGLLYTVYGNGNYSLKG